MGHDSFRLVASRVALALVFGLLPIGMVSVWISAVVANSGRYVDTVAPLASDPVVKQAAIDRLDASARQMIDPSGGGLVGQYLLAGTHAVVVGVVDGPFFSSAWVAANRSAHTQLMAILEGHGDQVVGPDGRITIGLGGMLDTIASGLGQAGAFQPDSGPPVATSFRLAKVSDLGRAEFSYRALHPLGYWPLLTWLLVAAAVIALASDRARAVRHIGVVCLGSMAALFVVLAYARHEVAATSPDAVIGRAIWDAVTRDLRRVMLLIAVVSATVVAATFVVRRRPGEVAVTATPVA